MFFSDQRFWNCCYTLRHIPLVAGNWHLRRLSESGLGRPVQRTSFWGRPWIFKVFAKAETGPIEPVHVKRQARNHSKIRSLEVRERQKNVFIVKCMLRFELNKSYKELTVLRLKLVLILTFIPIFTSMCSPHKHRDPTIAMDGKPLKNVLTIPLRFTWLT